MAAVTAVIPNLNGERFLPRLLADLRAQSAPPERVIVADNGSTDGSAQLAEAGGAEVIRLGRNTGFAHAVNIGVSRAGSELVAVLNNDVELAEDWLERLCGALHEDPSAWFATGKIYQAARQDLLDATFDCVARSGCAWRCGQGRPDGPGWNQRRRIRVAPLTAAVARRRLFEEVGPLDEEFESYLEDVEFGLRCARAGRHGLYVPEATARHWGSATLGVWHPETVRLIARNQVLLVAKHYPRDWPLRYGWAVLAGQLLWGLVAARHGALSAYLRGKMEAIRRLEFVRRTEGPAAALEEVLEEGERTIRELQRAGGQDWYWRLYFAVT